MSLSLQHDYSQNYNHFRDWKWENMEIKFDNLEWWIHTINWCVSIYYLLINTWDFPHLSRLALGPTQPPVQWVPGLSRGVKSGRGVTLTPHPLLVPWSRKGRAIPLLHLWAVWPVQSLSACIRVHFTVHQYMTSLLDRLWSTDKEGNCTIHLVKHKY